MKKLMRAVISCAVLGGCAMTRQESTVDLNAALDVAAAGQASYAAQPGADPAQVAHGRQLLAAAQAALLAWSNSTNPADQTAADAAMAALVAYQAAGPAQPAH
jgi:hypothetical protein